MEDTESPVVRLRELFNVFFDRDLLPEEGEPVQLSDKKARLTIPIPPNGLDIQGVPTNSNNYLMKINKLHEACPMVDAP